MCGDVDYDTAETIITWILESGFKKKKTFDHLTLLINSPGGDLNCGFAIIDIMRGSSIPVHTVGIGEIGSCGLMIFLAGTIGHRILTPNTTILSHIWAASVHGKAHDLLSAQKDFNLTTERMLAHYKLCTGLDDEIIKQKLLPAHDIFLTAEEALSLNICDEIKHLR